MSDESRPLPSPVPPQDRRGGVTLGPDHTRIPNQLIDLVYPWLSAGEKACLMYIIRRTYGFVSPTHPRQRKQWDRIALSQFIDGTSSGGYVLDLGAGMTRPAVISSLGKLEDRELVRVSYECPTTLTKSGRAVGCGWNEGDEDHLQRPVIDPKTNAHSCPRCSRTLSKAYALRKLTPGWIKRFLNANDPAGREWSYDPEVGRFYPENVDSEEPAGKADQTAEKIKEMQAKIWFPDLLDKIIGDATSRLKSGKMASSRLIREFLEPTLVMQDKLPREAVQYGMQEVIKRRIAAQPGKRGWAGYAKACAQGFAERKHGGGVAVEQAMQQAGVEMELERCAQLNRDGQKEEARRVLQELLSANLDKLQEEFSGDRALARRHVLEAYKRGISDYAYVRDYTSTADWLPEWDWLRDEGSSPPVPQPER